MVYVNRGNAEWSKSGGRKNGSKNNRKKLFRNLMH